MEQQGASPQSRRQSLQAFSQTLLRYEDCNPITKSRVWRGSLTLYNALFSKVRVVLTKSALHFWERAKVYDATSWEAYLSVADRVKLYTDEDEWSAWDAVGDPVVHIQVRIRECRWLCTRVLR